MGGHRSGFTPVGRILILAAAFVIVVAGMREAQSLIVPFLIALLVAVVCAPGLLWLKKKNVPTFLALLIVVVGIVGATLLIGTLLGSSVSGFSDAVPAYQQRLEQKAIELISVLEKLGIPVDRSVVLDQFNPGVAIQYASRLLRSLGGLLTNAFLIFLVVIFILLETLDFPARIQAALPDPGPSLETLRRVADDVNRYIALKTGISICTGVIVWLFLVVIGVDFPVLWGLLAFIFNFVPNIGSILAAIPAVLLAVVQFGFGMALVTAGGYMVVNIAIGSIIEPRVMGRGLGVSTLVVFVSLVFWGWIFGPVGMLLSVPLTVLVKIALGSRDETRWISVLMGSAPEPALGERGKNRDDADPVGG